jgi:hypothetical protein
MRKKNILIDLFSKLKFDHNYFNRRLTVLILIDSLKIEIRLNYLN